MTDSAHTDDDRTDDDRTDNERAIRPDLDRAASAIERGELVVYPTETVYGLGANALDTEAVKRVFECKGRSPDRPISLAVPTAAAASEYARPTDREERFMDEFLPGPVTVLLQRRPIVPDALVANREVVGVRVPDHDLAQAFCRRCGPVTATSANRSGGSNARRASDVDPRVRETASVVLDGGRTGGTESTVVDVRAGEIVRRGVSAEKIETWLADR